MKTKLFVAIILMVRIVLPFSQNIARDSIFNEIKILRLENQQLRTEYNALKATVHALELKQRELQTEQAKQLKILEYQNNELSVSIDTVNRNSIIKFSTFDSKLQSNILFGIVGLLLVSLLSAIVYILLGKKLITGKSQIESQISQVKRALEEEGIKLDAKLVEILETQLKLLQNHGAQSTGSNEMDHSLALKVADEIIRINKNLSQMDPGIRGLKQLSASVKRIEDNFAANGYEMPELLNKPFDTRLKVIVANSIPDDNLLDGQEIITRIIKPQVNFNGVMIQAAQVEVSVGQKSI